MSYGNSGVVVSSPPGTEETVALGREIEFRRGIPRFVENQVVHKTDVL
jgi:hypothetical protein